MVTFSIWCFLLSCYWSSSFSASLPWYWSIALLLLISFLIWKLLYTSCSTEGGEFPVPYIFKKDESSPGWEYKLIDFENMWTWLLSFQQDPLSAQIRKGLLIMIKLIWCHELSWCLFLPMSVDRLSIAKINIPNPNPKHHTPNAVKTDPNPKGFPL